MNKGTALITGASSGIGAALAKHFAAKGHDLVITARREQHLIELKNTIGDATNIDIIKSDLSSSAGCTELIQTIQNRNIDIDILVNNAGVTLSGDFVDMEETKIENLLSLNIVAVTLLTRHFLQPMIKKGSGRILNLASVAAFQPVPSMNIYAASKAYVLSLSESLSEELKATGVSVTALCPGLTRTESVDLSHASMIPPMLISSAEEVAAEGYQALMAKEAICMPGIANQAAVTLAQHQPRWLIRSLGGLIAKISPLKHP